MTDVLVSEGTMNRVRGRNGSACRRPCPDHRGRHRYRRHRHGLVGALTGRECRYGTDAKSDFNEPLGPAKPSDRVQLCTLMLLGQRLRPEAKIHPAKLKGYMAVPSDGAMRAWIGQEPCHAAIRVVRSPLPRPTGRCFGVSRKTSRICMGKVCRPRGPKLGIREARRVVGDHVLTVNDLMGSKRPEDSVAVGTYGVDTWGQPEYDKHPIPLTPGGYGIPLRALLTKGMENLMVVGKCLIATHLPMSADGFSALRLRWGKQPVSWPLWPCSRRQLRALPLAKLQAKLKAAGIPI